MGRQTWSVLLPGLRIPTAKPAIGCGLFSTSITFLFLYSRFFLFLCLRFFHCSLLAFLPLSSTYALTCLCHFLSLCLCSFRSSAILFLPLPVFTFFPLLVWLCDCMCVIESIWVFLKKCPSFRKNKVILVCVCSAIEHDCEKSRWSLFVRSRAPCTHENADLLVRVRL